MCCLYTKGKNWNVTKKIFFSKYKNMAFQCLEGLHPPPPASLAPLPPTPAVESDWPWGCLSHWPRRIEATGAGGGEHHALWKPSLEDPRRSLPSQPRASGAWKLPTKPTPTTFKKKQKSFHRVIIFLEWDLLYNILITAALKLKVLCSWSQGPSWDVALNEVYNSI